MKPSQGNYGQRPDQWESCGGGGFLAAQCQDDMCAIMANCALIVAAPELLACLLDVLDADGDLDAMDFTRYRAAIAKATGGEL